MLFIRALISFLRLSRGRFLKFGLLGAVKLKPSWRGGVEARRAGLGGAGGGFCLNLTLGVGRARAVLSVTAFIEVGAEHSAAFLLSAGNH